MGSFDQAAVRRSLMYFLIAGVCGYMFYERYWIWRDCLAAGNGTCVTSEATSISSSGMYWALPAILFVIAGALILRNARRSL